MTLTRVVAAAAVAFCVASGASSALAKELSLSSSPRGLEGLFGVDSKDAAQIAEQFVSDSLWNFGDKGSGSRDRYGWTSSQQTCNPPAPPIVSCTPEPSTWMLTIVAIGGVGLMLRSAKKTRFDALAEVAAA